MNNTVCTATNTKKCTVDKHDGNGGKSGHFDFSLDGYNTSKKKNLRKKHTRHAKQQLLHVRNKTRASGHGLKTGTSRKQTEMTLL